MQNVASSRFQQWPTGIGYNVERSSYGSSIVPYSPGFWQHFEKVLLLFKILFNTTLMFPDEQRQIAKAIIGRVLNMYLLQFTLVMLRVFMNLIYELQAGGPFLLL